MLTALRSTIAAIGLSMIAVVAAIWIFGLGEPAHLKDANVPLAPPGGAVYGRSHCAGCPGNGITPVTPRLHSTIRPG